MKYIWLQSTSYIDEGVRSPSLLSVLKIESINQIKIQTEDPNIHFILTLLGKE